MARTPSPWYRAERDEGASSTAASTTSLVIIRKAIPPPRKQRKRWNVPPPILDRFHELLAAKPNTTPFPPQVEVRVPVADVFEKFLGWCLSNRSPRTYEWSRNHIQSFVNALKARGLAPGAFAAEELRPFHVNEWVDAHKVAKPGAARGGRTTAAGRSSPSSGRSLGRRSRGTSPSPRSATSRSRRPAARAGADASRLRRAARPRRRRAVPRCP